MKILTIAQIIYPVVDLTTSDQLNKVQKRCIADGLTLKALSTTKIDITPLEYFLISGYCWIDHGSNYIYSVSYHDNTVSNSITSTKSGVFSLA
jgi:hypothetical protein